MNRAKEISIPVALLAAMLMCFLGSMVFAVALGGYGFFMNLHQAKKEDTEYNERKARAEYKMTNYIHPSMDRRKAV